MRFLQPDLHPTNTLSLRLMEFHSERSCFLKDIDSSLLIRSIRAVSNGQLILNPALTQGALNWIKAWPAQAEPVQGNPFPIRKSACWRW